MRVLRVLRKCVDFGVFEGAFVVCVLLAAV